MRILTNPWEWSRVVSRIPTSVFAVRAMCFHDIDQLLRCSNTGCIHQRSRRLIHMSTGGIDYIVDLRRSFCTRIGCWRKKCRVSQPRYMCIARRSHFYSSNRSAYLGWRLLRILARTDRSTRRWYDFDTSVNIRCQFLHQIWIYQLSAFCNYFLFIYNYIFIKL